MNNLYQKIAAELRCNGNKKRTISNKRFHKYEIHELGVEAKVRDKIFKQFTANLKELGCKEALMLARKLYSTRIEEFAMAGNYVLEIKSDCIDTKQLSYLDKNLNYFRSWSTIDDFCIDVLQPVLVRFPKETIELLKKWNKSKNMWKRRASVVAFTRKIGESGKFTDIALELCNNLINDNNDLIKKGVGWALKDNVRGNKKKVIAYIKKLRKNKVSSTIILYAIRDLENTERKEILNI